MVKENRCYFEELPQDLILEIFSFLEPKELTLLSCVSSLCRRLASHGRILDFGEGFNDQIHRPTVEVTLQEFG